MMNKLLTVTVLLILCLVVPAVRDAFSDGPGNLTSSGNKHNLSVNSQNSVRAKAETGVTEICVFCHTPHRSMSEGPLWNHTLSAVSNYTMAESPTQLSPKQLQPDGDSRLCLSCHDGTVPIGAVQNLGVYHADVLTSPIPMEGVDAQGYLASGFGSDLSGHHLVSIEYSGQLNLDKIQQCDNGDINYGVKPKNSSVMPYLKPTGNSYPGGSDSPKVGVQCTSCHDPHLDNPTGSKFLRQTASMSWGTNFSDNMCMACHCYCTDPDADPTPGLSNCQ